MESSNNDAQKMFSKLNLHPTKGEKEIINLLILGESGVGKSSFVTTMINYFYYDSLSDITSVDSLYIPISQKVSIPNREPITLKSQLGLTWNEDLSVGCSSTKHCTSYELRSATQRLTLIDTPGLCDTGGGLAADIRHIHEIIEFLRPIGHLNAICILLKTYETRLFPSSKEVLKELLCNLDVSAMPNIVWIITHGKGANFDVESNSTDECLGEFLRELDEEGRRLGRPPFPIPRHPNNKFMFDSEWFHLFVRSFHSPGPGCEAERRKQRLEHNMMELCWEQSKLSFKNLLSYAARLPPHELKSTLDIHDAREKIEDIYKCFKPLLKVIAERDQEFDETKANIESGRGDLHMSSDGTFLIKTKQVVSRPFDEPRVICRSGRCAKSAGSMDYFIETNDSRACYVSPASVREVIGNAAQMAAPMAHMAAAQMPAAMGNMAGPMAVPMAVAQMAVPMVQMAAAAATEALSWGICSAMALVAEGGLGALMLTVVGGTVAFGAIGGAVGLWYANELCPKCKCKFLHHRVTYEDLVVETQITRESSETHALNRLHNLREESKYEKEALEDALSSFTSFLIARTLQPFNNFLTHQEGSNDGSGGRGESEQPRTNQAVLEHASQVLGFRDVNLEEIKSKFTTLEGFASSANIVRKEARERLEGRRQIHEIIDKMRLVVPPHSEFD